MTPRNFGLDHQGKREDQVSFVQVVAGILIGLLMVVAIGSCFIARAR